MSIAAAELDTITAWFFLDVAVILVVARLAGGLARRLRQPAVIGEVIGGLALGPSLLGALPGDLTGTLFPAEVRPFLGVAAQLGLIIFMFIIGLEFDLSLIRGRGRSAAVISVSSILLPFALGIPLAALLHQDHGVVAGVEIDFLSFALFIGASMSVTAFPVLARILRERGMVRTTVGSLALACAAVDDLMAWTLLAAVLAVLASSGAWGLPLIVLESLAFMLVMVFLVRPLLARLVARSARKSDQLGPEVMATVLVLVLLASYTTATIGIHQIFGAFVVGAVMPRDPQGRLLSQVLDRLETVSVLLLLPVFFAVTGLGVDVRGLATQHAGEFALILLVACAGKFLGASLAARTQGLDRRRSAAIGVLMNTRGLTELVILNVGLSFGVLDPQLFTMLVIMAVVTTVITEPLLRLVYPDRLLASDVARADRTAVGAGPASRVLVSVGDYVHAQRMVDLAVDLQHGKQDAEVVITRFAPRRSRAELGSGLVADRELVSGWMGELDALARRVEARGVRSVVRYQLSDDVAKDLVTQADSVDAGALLIGFPRDGEAAGQRALDRFSGETGLDYADFLERVLAGAGCPVGVVVHPLSARPSRGRAVLVVLDDGQDRQTASAAVSVAGAAGCPLEVLRPYAREGDDEPPPAVADLARAAGLTVTAQSGDAAVRARLAEVTSGDLVVVGASPAREPGRLGSSAEQVLDAVDGVVLAVSGATSRRAAAVV